MRLTPRDTTFDDLLAASAAHLVTGADLLARLLGAARGDERRAVAEELLAVEHRADEATHEVVRRINATFVTPFDREDIYRLASGLDDCIDHMEEAGDLVVLYELDGLPAGVADQVAVLQRQAELTAEAMPRLRRTKDLAEYWVEINRLENQADAVHRRVVADLFASEKDPVTLLKTKGVVDALEDAADAFEGVSHVVETIAVKGG